MLNLQYIDFILNHTHDQCAQSCQNRNQNQNVQHGDTGCLRQIDSEKVHVHTADRVNNGLNVHAREGILQIQKFWNIVRIGKKLYHAKLRGGTKVGHTEYFSGFCCECVDYVCGHMKQMLQWLVYHINQSEYDGKLQKQRPYTRHGTVFFSFVQRGLCIYKSILIINILIFQRVQLRLHFYHFDGVFLYKQGDGKHYNFCEQGKENDGDSVIAEYFVAKPHEPAKRRADNRVYNFHWILQ